MLPVECRSVYYKLYPVPDPAFLILQDILTVPVSETVFGQQVEEQKTVPFTRLPEI
jgi:hypothetical protein